MGKYTDNESDVFSVFNSLTWKAENIDTVPTGYKGDTADEHVRISIIPSGPGVNKRSTSGIIIVDIFTPAGSGPRRQNFIADKLDVYLANKSLQTQSGGTTQFLSSTLQPLGVDKAKPTLERAKYEIPFNFFRSE